jgi:D-3-phosphoglycerate dehydrogenase / 2-oxoglutarate reductase
VNNQHIIIDFDSTFIQVEALDELAEIALVNHPEREARIKAIKDFGLDGMAGKIPFSVSLNSRLKLLNANHAHCEQLIALLHDKVSRSFKRNSDFLKRFAANIYIVSSGFKEYILPVVSSFGIEKSQVFANTFRYDAQGNIIGLDTDNPLCQDQGKVRVVKDLKLKGLVSMIGDGITDYEVRALGAADTFYAFTENIERSVVVNKADVVLKDFDEFLYRHNFSRSISYPRHRIKILLLENVHPYGIKMLEEDGYSVESLKGGMSEEELCAKIKDVSVLGIRSKTRITRKVLEAAERLISIGAFCIGTNQIDLAYATKQGITVFNAPYSNTRSVVEMALGEIIMLMRKVVSKNNLMHQGIWHKSAVDCFELRYKKLGIIGYGNIGAQLSVLAESLGMEVFYYDIAEKLQLGTAKKCDTLDELLAKADVVTLHVDGRKSNTHLIGARQFDLMKDKVIFVNLSRGHVVDIDALVKALKSGKVLGAALDVFPDEPKNNQEEFINPLRGFDNVILSPHIGGSTEEAQLNIGGFVARKMMNYVNTGDTTQCVNLPNILLPELKKAHRLMHLHTNVPGILAQINNVLSRNNANVLGQYLKTNEHIGYVITDINVEYDKNMMNELKEIKGTLKSRIVY